MLWRLAVPRRLLASSKDACAKPSTIVLRGGDSVQLSTGETADHSVPKQDRDVLKEASSTAISFTIEDMELLA